MTTYDQRATNLAVVVILALGGLICFAAYQASQWKERAIGCEQYLKGRPAPMPDVPIIYPHEPTIEGGYHS